MLRQYSDLSLRADWMGLDCISALHLESGPVNKSASEVPELLARIGAVTRSSLSAVPRAGRVRHCGPNDTDVWPISPQFCFTGIRRALPGLDGQYMAISGCLRVIRCSCGCCARCRVSFG